MDDSPRSSKRRKLDIPKRIESKPAAKPSTTTITTRKSSGRLAKNSAPTTNGGAASEVEDKPARKGRVAKGASNGTAAKSVAAENVDIYDDIEGALNVGLSSQPSRRAQAASREKSTSTVPRTDALQIKPTPKRAKGRPAKAETTSRNLAKSLLKGNGNGVDDGVGSTKAVTAPTKPAKRTPAASARKPAVSRANARRKKEPSPVADEDNDTDELQGETKAASPAKPQSTRKPAASTRKKVAAIATEDGEAVVATPSRSLKRRKPLEERATRQEAEDELSDASPSSRRKLPMSVRRRQNRTDHITNHDEEQTDGHDEDDMDVDGNSILGSVLDPTEPSPFNKPTSAQKEKEKEKEKESSKQKTAPPLLYSNLIPGRELDLLKTIVVERITNRRPSPLVGLDEEYQSVHQLVEQTITAGEGNSMLVIGARGSGKTALVNKVLAEVSKENGGQYHVVRLNGFVHTDDKIALREIWRQLGKEMDIEEDGSGPGKNYADTLATLLALLSHPSEQTGQVTDEVAKAVIFVMDEFDLFAQHPRQTLLYNLFDIAQSRKAPIAVLGLTTRIDVTNSLEKRVKSRFSHRYVHLKLATTFTAFQEICKACLLLHPEQLSVEERGILEGGVKDTTPAKKTKRNEATPSALTQWNTNITVSHLSLLLHKQFTNLACRNSSQPPLS
ncbi:origin recognition complex subunit 4 [Pyrenophora seminiperda CCB06]|uniref:Origin recognition complex subunit 4 n=1 Tax=Pyrenophora seminiperda CCB06 TaxID=1302712 RepID=A0A3M7MG30_9PLEO|nr:origin recognition complex subunit 4 [Pyrenophora seminiperda CCB06]